MVVLEMLKSDDRLPAVQEHRIKEMRAVAIAHIGEVIKDKEIDLEQAKELTEDDKVQAYVNTVVEASSHSMRGGVLGLGAVALFAKDERRKRVRSYCDLNRQSGRDAKSVYTGDSKAFETHRAAELWGEERKLLGDQPSSDTTDKAVAGVTLDRIIKEELQLEILAVSGHTELLAVSKTQA